MVPKWSNNDPNVRWRLWVFNIGGRRDALGGSQHGEGCLATDHDSPGNHIFTQGFRNSGSEQFESFGFQCFGNSGTCTVSFGSKVVAGFRTRFRRHPSLEHRRRGLCAFLARRFGYVFCVCFPEGPISENPALNYRTLRRKSCCRTGTTSLRSQSRHRWSRSRRATSCGGLKQESQ